MKIIFEITGPQLKIKLLKPLDNCPFQKASRSKINRVPFPVVKMKILNLVRMIME